MEVLRISNFGKDVITGIYQSNFDVRYTAREAQILQLSFETQSSFMYFVWLFVFAFDQLLSYWNSLAVAFLAVKIKRHLHFS